MRCEVKREEKNSTCEDDEADVTVASSRSLSLSWSQTNAWHEAENAPSLILMKPHLGKESRGQLSDVRFRGLAPVPGPCRDECEKRMVANEAQISRAIVSKNTWQR